MDNIYEYIPPRHHTLTNISLLLKKYSIDKLLITEKIDGIYKYDIINEEVCQFELLNDKKFIFNSTNNIILNPDTYDDFIKMLDYFHKSIGNNKIINKPYYRLNLDILEHIDDIINLENNLYATDGWILASEDLKFLIKLKPLKHMTIDLFYNCKIKKWFTRERKIIDLPNYDISSGIWRLYYSNNKWIPRDLRYDKHKANQYKVVKYIMDFINKPFSLNKLIKMVLSQELYYGICDNINTVDTIKYIKNNNIFIKKIVNKYCKQNYNVLDIGCGKGKYIIEKTNWFGIDIDLGVLDIPERYENFSGLWLDFTKKWDPVIQEKSLGNLWKYYKNKLFDLKSTQFDLVLWFYSLHFCETIEQLEIVFNEINNLTSNKSILILNLIKKQFDNIIFSNGYIKRNNNIIKRYYNWCNDKETIEYIWNLDVIINISKYWSIQSIIQFEEYFDEPINEDMKGWNEWNKNNYIIVLQKFL